MHRIYIQKFEECFPCMFCPLWHTVAVPEHAGEFARMQAIGRIKTMILHVEFGAQEPINLRSDSSLTRTGKHWSHSI